MEYVPSSAIRENPFRLVVQLGVRETIEEGKCLPEIVQVTGLKGQSPFL
jgi:hypothetical protein